MDRTFFEEEGEIFEVFFDFVDVSFSCGICCTAVDVADAGMAVAAAEGVAEDPAAATVVLGDMSRADVVLLPVSSFKGLPLACLFCVSLVVKLADLLYFEALFTLTDTLIGAARLLEGCWVCPSPDASALVGLDGRALCEMTIASLAGDGMFCDDDSFVDSNASLRLFPTNSLRGLLFSTV